MASSVASHSSTFCSLYNNFQIIKPFPAFRAVSGFSPLGGVRGGNMKKIKITLVKSPIDRPERQKLTLQALGLNKTNSTKEVEATPQVLGMVRKVEHLLKVEELTN